MFCKNCGKQLADDAFMCPNCGSPASKPHAKPCPSLGAEMGSLPLVAFVLSLIAIVFAPFVAAAFFICYYTLVIILASIALILITLGGFIAGLTAVTRVHTQPARAKVFSILSVVFSSVVLLLLFVCLLVFLFI